MDGALFIVVGLVAAIAYALSILLKKYVFQEIDYPEYPFTIIATGVHTLIGILIVILLGIDIVPTKESIALLIIAGAIYGISLIFYYYAIHHDDASRVSQLCSLEAVFTPIAAILILGESPSKHAIVGVLLIITAILLLTLERDLFNVIKTTKFAVLPLFIAIGIWAIEDVIVKHVLYTVDFVVVYLWLRTVSFLTLGSLFSIHSKTRSTIRKTATDTPRVLLLVFLTSAIISASALLLTLLTYSLGPLSLASPLVSSYPLFVLLFLYLSSRYFKVELESKKNLPKRTISAVLFISGIIILSIT